MTPSSSPDDLSETDRVNLMPDIIDRMPASSLDVLSDRAEKTARAFPALEERPVLLEAVRPGNTHPTSDPLAAVEPDEGFVFVPADSPATFMTLYLGFARIAIQNRVSDGEDLPETSTEFCAVYAVSRMDPDHVDADSIPYIGTPGIPAEEWPTACQDGLEARSYSKNYLERTRKWLEI